MTHSSAELLNRYERGDDDAADALFARYADRLLALARSRLSAKLARRIDADDVVQSTYRSFFARARAGKFAADEPGDLWRLLATIALHKVRRQARRHRAARRSVDRELASDAAASLAHTAANSPSPEDVVAVGEEFDWLLSQLSPSEGEAIQLRLQGLTLEQVALSLGRSERTVRRWLAAAHELLTARWTHSSTSSTDDSPSSAASEWAFAATSLGPSNDPMPLRHSEYHLEKLIGAGGVCKVYVAREKATGRRVAVKVLRKHLQRRAPIVARFVKEAEIVRLLAHPRIVAVHGLGRLPRGGCFMVMDYIDGSDLAQIVSRGPLEPRRAAGILALIVETIQHAHEHGVVHRDLKPGNVLLDRDGNVFVSDFGFAWLHAEGQQDTTIVGTEGYMAPEQIDPALGPIGPWTDVYGLGALLFELLTGRAPREAESTDRRQKKAEPAANFFDRDVWLLTDANPLAKLVSRCLAADWRERFASAAELGHALHGILAD